MADLKPCPFCGGTNLLVSENGYYVSCENGMHGVAVDLDVWNQRPIEDRNAIYAVLSAAATLAACAELQQIRTEVAHLRSQLAELQAQSRTADAMRDTQRVTYVQDGQKVRR